jgi:hypothetical protein
MNWVCFGNKKMCVIKSAEQQNKARPACYRLDASALQVLGTASCRQLTGRSLHWALLLHYEEEEQEEKEHKNNKAKNSRKNTNGAESIRCIYKTEGCNSLLSHTAPCFSFLTNRFLLFQSPFPDVGSDVLTALGTKRITPCSPLKVNRCFGGTYCLHLQQRICQVRQQFEIWWQSDRATRFSDRLQGITCYVRFVADRNTDINSNGFHTV